MINVDRIYRRVNNDLLLKGKGGYISGDEFNRSAVDAQNYLFEFFVQKEKETQRIMDALSPFVVEAFIPIVSGYVAKPADYSHERDLIVEVMDTGCVGNNVTYTRYPANKLKSNEYSALLNSTIRKPDIAQNKYSYEFIGSNIKIYPEAAKDRIYLKYVRTPAAAVWGFTLDVGNDQENYNSGSSTDFEWNESEANALINVLLYLKGVQIRDSEVVNWMSLNKQIVEAQ